MEAFPLSCHQKSGSEEHNFIPTPAQNILYKHYFKTLFYAAAAARNKSAAVHAQQQTVGRCGTGDLSRCARAAKTEVKAGE